MKIVVIGSGISGLTAAAYLAKAGHEVTVFEQFEQVGGVTARFERHGYRWDLGQMIIQGFGPGEPIGDVLSELGLTDKVRAVKDDRAYVFPDFEIRKPERYSGPTWRINRLKELFPDEEDGLDKYWRCHLRVMSLMTLARKLEKASGLKAAYLKLKLYLKFLPLMPKKNWDAQRLMDSFFKSRKLQAVFISILADFFTPPNKFLGLGVFAVNPETSFDKRIPKELANGAEELPHYSVVGGISTVIDALAGKIRESGGEIYTSCPVSGITVGNGRVIGVADAARKQTPADVVVASGGAKETFLRLVGKEHLPPQFVTQVRELPLMDSVFMVHLGVDFDPAPYFQGVCTYYYGAYDLDRVIATAKAGIYHEGKDGFVLHVPTLRSPEMAPPGHHSMTIYTICPDKLKDGSWNERKEEYADKLVAHAEKYLPGLRNHVKVREIITPDDFRRRTYTEHHSFGGLAPFMGKPGIPHRTPIEGLWFVGGQSEGGDGVSNVLTAAYKVAKLINAGGVGRGVAGAN
ncbi:MAG: NAD(P)/FAD-dependent oxidoreductase [Candidatus Lindowbacteria bacterium]|nr:NAD(P)/FAD-dependent oxidoreductase [Candidatus Lindowbacteria bacterium]